ncbi:MAG: hypothetical protein JWL76_1305 [Thermoleophilia bacterium]|nr:hypothetical protein [Thermoleophilia bacterium]
MNRSKFGAASALLAGLLLIIVPLLVEFVSGDAFALMAVAALLFLVSLPGLHRVQGGADGAAGRRGLRMLLIGLVVLVVLIAGADPLDAAVSGAAQDVVETAFMAFAGSASLVALIGLVMFGTGMLRAKVLPASWTWVFLLGLVLAIVSETFEQSLSGVVPTIADVLPPLGFIVGGIGLAMIGRAAWSLASASRVSPATEPAAATS